MQKNENRLCQLPYVYEEVLEDIIKTVWTEQCGNLKELKFCLPTLQFLQG